jgi:hypothetical protein
MDAARESWAEVIQRDARLQSRDEVVRRFGWHGSLITTIEKLIAS